MSTASKPAHKILYYSKFLGLALIVIGIPIMLIDKSSGAEMPLLVGLFTLFVATEKIQDERSVQLKTTSLYLSFCISYALKLLTSNLNEHALISFQLVEINHFLILVLALANAVFYSRLYILKQ
ncbi:hypothetical protein [Chryseolinea lacunae]|uniref:Uncharacterized protein n=1 Tax=Chryseolinea lacunae TaxID=2801331 RepID=A0ABS1KMK6_9BACT|nr:hypothetical protein [Chryseolinea lacunae]MBL0740671.1 hypothetical protein [Chryseolinea lacunae]